MGKNVLDLRESICYKHVPAYRFEWSGWKGYRLDVDGQVFYEGVVELYGGIVYARDSVISIIPPNWGSEEGFPLFNFNMNIGDTVIVNTGAEMYYYLKDYEIWLVGKIYDENLQDEIYEFKLTGLASTEELWTVFVGWKRGIVGMTLSSIYYSDQKGQYVEHITSKVGITDFQIPVYFKRFFDDNVIFE